jgi:diaminopimelate decarboxylase
MNDLIRPGFYGAYHEILPEEKKNQDAGPNKVSVVGPVCESGDFLANGRLLPPLLAGDLIALKGAGAYGFSMSSNYNSRPRAAEVLVDGEEYRVVRKRETFEDLVRGEMS